MAEPIGLVLSGGGAKGAYEVGVYKALSHYNITEHITAFSGTSVGALNAVLLDSLGAAAEKVWLDLKLSDMMTLDVGRIAKNISSLFTDSPDTPDPSTVKLSNLSAVAKYLYPDVDSLYTNGLPFTQDRLSELIDKNVDFKNLRHKIYVHSVRIGRDSSLELETFRLGSVLYDDQQRKDMVLASAALPGVYCGTEGVKIKGMEGSFVDGGYPGAGDNTPIATLYNKGFRRIIAVHLKDDADISGQSKFTGAQIVNIIPSESMGGFFTGTLNLTPEKIRRDINLGYNDTLAALPSLRSLTV